MSGHSKWHNIKYKKALADKKRGQIFSKITRQIEIAAREGGGDPETNSALRMAIERAKSFNLPKEKIERAIKRGVGKLEGVKYEKFLYEAFGPGGVAMIIEGVTDNKNRALSEIKKVLRDFGGKLAEEGSVKWLFEKKGVILIDREKQREDFKNKENLELIAIESGASNFSWRENFLEIQTTIEKLEEVKNFLKNKGIKIEDASLDWVAKEEIKIGEEIKRKCQSLFSALDELDSVQEIYSNLKI